LIPKKKQSIKVQQTIRNIKSVFEKLICEKDFENIKVSHIVKGAKINKKTFYRYYKNIGSLLKDIQKDFSKEFLQIVKDYKLPDEFDKVNREFFLYSAKQGKAYEKITCGGNYKQIRDKMVDTVITSSWTKSEKFNSLDSAHQKIIINFVTTSSLEAYKQWISDGKKVPLEEIIKLSNCMITNAIKAFVKNIKEDTK
jgi:AcrR family transcriptional regulator